MSTEQGAGAAGCPRGHQWQVHKFGGTCVSAAERIQRVAQLVVDASADSQQARFDTPALRHSIALTSQQAAPNCLACRRDAHVSTLSCPATDGSSASDPTTEPVWLLTFLPGSVLRKLRSAGACSACNI